MIATPERESRADVLADWLLTVGIGLAVAGVVALAAGHFLQAFVVSSLDHLDADRDDNVFAWASSVAAFGAAFAAFLLYGLSRRAVLLVLAILLAFLSLDDIVTVHEKLAVRSVEWFDLDFDARRAVWIALYLPLLAATFVLLLRVTREASARGRNTALVGLGLLPLAILAEGMTYLTHAAGHREGTTLDTIEVAVEEGAELAGWILIAAALTAHACADLLAAGRSAAPRVN